MQASVLTQVAAFCDQYGLWIAGEPRLLDEGVDNTNIVIDTPRGRFVVRRYERTPRSAIPFELDLIDHLVAQQFPVPHPLAARDGEYLHDLDGRPAAVFTFIDGSHPDEGDVGVATQVGSWLAEYHRAVAGFSPRYAKAYHERTELDRIAANAEALRRDGLGDFVDAAAELGATLDTHNVDALSDLVPRGVIHSDVNSGNLLCNDRGELVALLDFDTCYVGSFVRDIADTLLIWSMPRAIESPDIALASAVVTGYGTVRTLEVAESDLLDAKVLQACLEDAARFVLRAREEGRALESASDSMMYRRFLALHRLPSRWWEPK